LRNNSRVHNIQDQIISLLEDYLTDFPTHQEKIGYVFFRPSNIRLSYDGNRLLAKVCDSYPFKHSADFKPRHLISLTKKFKYPFYLSANYLVLYSEKDAVLLSLVGDPEEFLF
jgi:hypothetical protein